MAGKAPESDGDLASQPTLSRLENRVTAKDLRRLSDRLLELYLKTHPGPRKVIVLDMDATDDPTHGRQQLSFFHGYYEEHMYHPLLYLEDQPETRYVIGFITNNRVLAKAAPLLLKAQRQYQETGEKQRLFTSFSYQAES
jgi:hypothetical protein